MKRLFVLAGMILGFSVITMSVSAQTATSTEKSNGTQSQQPAKTCQGKIVDSNKDGICDNHQSGDKAAKCITVAEKKGETGCGKCSVKSTCSKKSCCGSGSTNANCCAAKPPEKK
jgi:hypothetical protein